VVLQDNTIHLARQVFEMHGRGVILDVADRRLNGDFDKRKMKCVLEVGLWCTSRTGDSGHQSGRPLVPFGLRRRCRR
jgi:hypothetical protein